MSQSGHYKLRRGEPYFFIYPKLNHRRIDIVLVLSLAGCARGRAMKNITIAVLFVTLFVGLFNGLASAEGWQCIEEQSPSFSYNETTKKFEKSFIRIENRYLIRKLIRKTEPKHVKFMNKHFKKDSRWAVFARGEKIASHECPKHADQQLGWLNCEGVSGKIRLNMKTLRFTKTYPAGYAHQGTLEDPDNNETTPNMSTGTCTPM
jgi:hypothetical protein